MSERIRTQHQDSLRTNVINLSELLHKSVRVSVHADKEVSGVLKGYDALTNLVLDNSVEFHQSIKRTIIDNDCITNYLDGLQRDIGTTIIKGSQVTFISPEPREPSLTAPIGAMMSVLETIGTACNTFVQNWARGEILGIPILMVTQAVCVTWSYRKNNRVLSVSPIEALIATFVLAFGGSTITSIILGKPWTFIQGNLIMPVYIITSLLMYYSPGDVLFRWLEMLGPISMPILLVSDAISKTLSVTYGGVGSVITHPTIEISQSVCAAILCGTISGCGGGILASLFNLNGSNWAFGPSSILKSPSLSIRLSLLSAILYVSLGTSFGVKKALLSHDVTVGLIFCMVSLAMFSSYFRENQMMAGKSKTVTRNSKTGRANKKKIA